MDDSSQRELGERGEDAAVDYLRAHGYCILARNVRSRYGEIDIVARDKATICFIEVKTRRRGVVPGFASVDRRKQRKLSLLAVWYLKEKRLCDRPARFDVVSVVWEERQPRIELIRNAFESAE